MAGERPAKTTVRPRMRHIVIHFVTSSWGEHMALQWITNIMVAVHIGLGVALIVAGPPRFSVPSYEPLVDLVDGRIWVWGVWILISASLMLIPARWPQIIGLWTGMFWHIMWSALFAVAILEHPTAGVTAAIAYGGFAAIDAALLTARIVERKE